MAQGDAASRQTAQRLLRLCRDHLRRARVRLVLVGGLPGTGKSTVAQRLAAETGAAVLRSDEIRKELAGLDRLARALAPLHEGLSDPSVTAATYEEMLSRAGRLLSLGESLIVDASWREPAWRQKTALLAEAARADLVELRCVAPIEVALERIERRLKSEGDPSDVTPEVARALARTDAPWPTATVLDTSGDLSDVVRVALAAVEGAGGGPG